MNATVPPLAEDEKAAGTSVMNALEPIRWLVRLSKAWPAVSCPNALFKPPRTGWFGRGTFVLGEP